MTKKFNVPFISTRALPTGGVLNKTKPTNPPATTAAPAAAPAATTTAAFSPQLGQRFKNGPRNYQTIYNDPTGRRAVIRDDQGNELLMRHSKLQSLLKGGPGTLDLSNVRRFSPNDASFFKRNTKGGQRYYAPGQKEAQEQAIAEEGFNTYAKSQRPAGAYHGSSGRAAMIMDTNEAPKPGAAKYYPVTKTYKKGGAIVKPSLEMKFGASPTKDKIPKPVKLVAKKEKCSGGKLRSKKMQGGKILKKAGDCGCQK